MSPTDKKLMDDLVGLEREFTAQSCEETIGGLHTMHFSPEGVRMIADVCLRAQVRIEELLELL